MFFLDIEAARHRVAMKNQASVVAGNTEAEKERQRWEEKELLILARIMKKKLPNKKAVQLCRINGMKREESSILHRWKKLRADHKIVREWEEDPDQAKSYFDMSDSERRRFSLPLKFSNNVHQLLEKRNTVLNYKMKKKKKKKKKNTKTTTKTRTVREYSDDSYEPKATGLICLEEDHLLLDSEINDDEQEDSDSSYKPREPSALSDSDTNDEEDHLPLVNEDNDGIDASSQTTDDEVEQQGVHRKVKKEVEIYAQQEVEIYAQQEVSASSNSYKRQKLTTDTEPDMAVASITPDAACASEEEDEEDQNDVIAFADGCLRFEEDNVVDGFLSFEGEHQAAGDHIDEAVKDEDEAGSKQQGIASVKCESRDPSTSDLQLVAVRSSEARKASQLYDRAVEQWRSQQVQLADDDKMEVLLRADSAFLMAVNQLVFAVRRLADKLH